jgi:hypothetical protein
MKQGFSAGCSLEVTLKFADYENLKPSFWCGVTEEWDTDVDGVFDVYQKIQEAQVACREICEAQIDKDIYDVKQIKVFEQILYKKGRK